MEEGKSQMHQKMSIKFMNMKEVTPEEVKMLDHLKERDLIADWEPIEFMPDPSKLREWPVIKTSVECEGSDLLVAFNGETEPQNLITLKRWSLKSIWYWIRGRRYKQR